MANNKFVLRDGTILLDLTSDTVTSLSLVRGATAHDASGSAITGAAQAFSFDASGRFRYPSEVVIPASVTSVVGDTGAFKGHTEITHITFDARETSIALQSDAFNGCTGLRNIELPSLITMTGNAIFRGCIGLTSLTIPDGVTAIGNYLCAGCTGLLSAQLSSSLTTIGFATFQGCTSLSEVKLQSNATFNGINTANGNNPFYNCTLLEDIQVPSGWTGGSTSTTTVISNGTANYTNVLTHDSIVAMIANLYDYSGGTAHTLTLGATNLARLSAAEQAVATAKNWTLA